MPYANLFAPKTQTLTTSEARDRLSALLTEVQHPQSYIILTRHGRPEAALVSMRALARIWDQEKIDKVIAGEDPTQIPRSYYGQPNREAAEAVRATQLKRREERRTLERCGMTPIPGGELEVELVEERAVPVTWWRRMWRR